MYVIYFFALLYFLPSDSNVCCLSDDMQSVYVCLCMCVCKGQAEFKENLIHKPSMR